MLGHIIDIDNVQLKEDIANKVTYITHPSSHTNIAPLLVHKHLTGKTPGQRRLDNSPLQGKASGVGLYRLRRCRECLVYVITTVTPLLLAFPRRGSYGRITQRNGPIVEQLPTLQK